MTYDQIINMTTFEFWKWFWEPFGVAQLVSLRDRLDDETICKLVQNQEWMSLHSRFDRDWFWNAVEVITG